MSTQVQAYQNDIDTLEFLEELREEIIDQYITILIAAGDTNCLNLFDSHLNSIFDFLEETSNIEGYNDPKRTKMIIALIGDIATQFPQNPGVKAKSTLPYIEKGILYLQQ